MGNFVDDVAKGVNLNQAGWGEAEVDTNQVNNLLEMDQKNFDYLQCTFLNYTNLFEPMTKTLEGLWIYV